MITASFLGESDTVQALLRGFHITDSAVLLGDLSGALHTFIRRGKEILVRLLIEQGADINDEYGYVNSKEIAWQGSPIEAAWEEGRRHIVDL